MPVRFLLALLTLALSALPMAANAEMATHRGQPHEASSTMDYCDMSRRHDSSKLPSNCFSTVCMAVILPAVKPLALVALRPASLTPIYARVDLGFKAGLEPPPPRFR